ncbi:major facilitator superfamily domain-containing protein [Coniella lustricola]|uniref:Major facilitator superfamily domain-containing protein n=1 Tax=Coniella lustricola TaxID=2025994 RepID=A0A2T3A1W9_9PEZI|nr:major facilitator superfamily domain-containing protein [Coniella lustricola]
MSGRSTVTIELAPVPLAQVDPGQPSKDKTNNIYRQSAPSPRAIGSLHDNDISRLPSPITASAPLERWNHPRSNTCRVLATFWSLMTMGLNDSALGAIIPYMGPYYHLSYTLVSLIFLSPFVGYTLAASLNNTIHMHYGQRGIAMLCGTCHLVAYVIAAQHPPYPALVVVFAVAGFGSGLSDAAFNAWIGAMANANEVLGVLHAFYGVGGVLGPLIATSLITKWGAAWYDFYYVMIGVAGVETVLLVSTFWPMTGKVFRDKHPQARPPTARGDGGGGDGGDGSSTSKKQSIMREALLQMPAARVSWLCAVFLLCYVGVEVALGGWIVTFMINERHGAAFASGMTATGFWLGLTMGRVTLGFVTPRLGERLALMIYLPAAMGLELLFWLVPQFIVSAVAVALVGFFLGPLFPAAVVAATKSLPKYLHVSTIGFAAAFGGGGAAVLPFAVGAIAQAKGVGVLQPIILALLAVLLLLWLALPNFSSKRE